MTKFPPWSCYEVQRCARELSTYSSPCFLFPKAVTFAPRPCPFKIRPPGLPKDLGFPPWPKLWGNDARSNSSSESWRKKLLPVHYYLVYNVAEVPKSTLLYWWIYHLTWLLTETPLSLVTQLNDIKKPVLRDHSHERSPILKEQTFLAEGPSFQPHFYAKGVVFQDRFCCTVESCN